MANYRGRNKLIRRYKNIKDKQADDAKELLSVIRVGDLLKKHLPSTTYIIAQPEIGGQGLDYLIISPEFGFRLVKVHHLQLASLEGVSPDGNFIMEDGDYHLTNQVRNSAEEIQKFLISNFSFFGMGDPYRNIGSSVIFSDFTRQEFTMKFANEIKNWSEIERANFGKYHLFAEDVNENITHYLRNTTKFSYEKNTLSAEQLRRIVIKIDEAEAIIRQPEKVVENKGMKQQSQGRLFPRFPTLNRSFKRVGNVTAIIVIILLLGGVGFFVMDVKDRPFRLGGNGSKSEEIEETVADVGDYVEVRAEVINIEAGNDDALIVTLLVGEIELMAVIFADVERIELELGKQYEFAGFVQSPAENNGIELRVERVK